MANFEAFCWLISSSINLLFLKSAKDINTIFFLNCEKCNITFQNSLEFTNHQTSSNCYEKCDKCDRRFISDEEKLSHKQSKFYLKKSYLKHSCMFKSLTNTNVVTPENYRYIF